MGQKWAWGMAAAGTVISGVLLYWEQRDLSIMIVNILQKKHFIFSPINKKQ